MESVPQIGQEGLRAAANHLWQLEPGSALRLRAANVGEFLGPLRLGRLRQFPLSPGDSGVHGPGWGHYGGGRHWGCDLLGGCGNYKKTCYVYTPCSPI